MFNKKELQARKDKRLMDLQSDDCAFGGSMDRGWDAYAALISPQEELKARLNAWFNWVDPGEPVHWRGL